MTHSALNRIILPGPVDFSENFDVFAAINCGFDSFKSCVPFQVLLIFEVAMEASTSQRKFLWQAHYAMGDLNTVIDNQTYAQWLSDWGNHPAPSLFGLFIWCFKGVTHSDFLLTLRNCIYICTAETRVRRVILVVCREHAPCRCVWYGKEWYGKNAPGVFEPRICFKFQSVDLVWALNN